MDALAVAIATGVRLKKVSPRQTFRLSWHFGLFQALMPILGWFGGSVVEQYLAKIDHWIAFVLLAFIGVRMILENFKSDAPDPQHKDPTRGMSLIMLSVATSIDALAVGFSLSMLQISIWYAALIIGLVAAGFTLAGLHLGRLISSISRVAHYATVFGGGILLGIGLKILYEHGAFSFIFS
jgi:putative Mn2+ efflux pump MntP